MSFDTQASKEAISFFDPVGLNEMEGVRLMNRKDTKYLFSVEQLPAVLKELNSNYSVLEIDGFRVHCYESLYFDTGSFKFYIDHHNGKLNRHKVRHRKYVESELNFVEVKSKNNKGMTRKRRMEISSMLFPQTALSEEEEEFVRKWQDVDPESLNATLNVEFSRLALVDKKFRERITIDVGLSYSVNEKRTKAPGDIVVAEVKRGSASDPSDFMAIMRRLRIQPTQFSKYCFGINLLYPLVKYNLFKPKNMAYNKLATEATVYTA